MKPHYYYILLILIAGCREQYVPVFTTPETGYLVVEGVINAGSDSTFVVLSRTNQVGSSQKRYEKGAAVQVEGTDNSVYALTELDTGRYAARFGLNDLIAYRLRIKTAAGKEYLSDFAEVKITPPIDSISWQRENGGVQLYVNTHDPQDKTRYYLWDYVETWEFHSPFKSVLKFVVMRSPTGTSVDIGYKDSINHSSDTAIFRCWRSEASTQLILGSSAKLSADLIYKPFLFIPGGDKKISVLYSINLRQYAVSKPAYEFFEKMKKNTEENGSIFDPQPSQLKGNIQCITDPAEPVIGYVNISTVKEQRIFISNFDVPRWHYLTDCEQVSVANIGDSVEEAWRSGSVPTTPLDYYSNNTIAHFGTTTLPCLDCTLSGTNKKPPFWP